MAIFIGILLTAGCGVAAGIFLGGFWWVTLGILVGLMETFILCLKYGELVTKDVDDTLALFIGLATLIGGILAGKIVGGFWWVILGFLIGAAAGVILYGAYKLGKVFPALLLILAPAGAVLASLYVDRRWFIVLLGILAGGLASFILSAPHIFYFLHKKNKQARMEAEKKRLRKERAEAKRKQKEEYERNRPVEEKLAELEGQALEVYKKNSAELRKAEKEFSKYKINLDKEFEKYINSPERYSSFETGFKAIFDSSSGVFDAQMQVMGIQNYVEGFAARYRVSAARAKLENDIYTANKKRAILFTERLKDIYDKLTPKQKERKIEDMVKTLKIGSINVKIPDTLPDAIALVDKFSEKRWQELGEHFRGYANFVRETKLVDGKSALLYLGGGLLKMGMSNYEDNEKAKLKLFKYQEKLIKKVPKLEEGRRQAITFSERAGELNRALEGTMKTYSKMFLEIFSTLYPPGDESKSKEARNACEQNGGDYFTDEEADAVIQLRTVGQFLVKLVKTKFEGDDDE